MLAEMITQPDFFFADFIMLR